MKILKALASLLKNVTKQSTTGFVEGVTTTDGIELHSHEYVKENGDGFTTSTIGMGNPHTHAIADDEIMPADTDSHRHRFMSEVQKVDAEEAVSSYEKEREATEAGLPGNPPAWIGEESKWDEAKSISEESFGEVRWPFVAWLYINRLKGRVK